MTQVIQNIKIIPIYINGFNGILESKDSSDGFKKKTVIRNIYMTRYTTKTKRKLKRRKSKAAGNYTETLRVEIQSNNVNQDKEGNYIDQEDTNIQFLKRYYLFIFREQGRREKERERNTDV